MTRTLAFLALASLSLPALSARPNDDLPERTGPRDLGDEPVEEFDLLSGEDDDDAPFLGELDDDIETIDLGLSDTPATRKSVRLPDPAGPGPITLDVAGRDPLADNYPLQVVAVDRDAVVVELPVLLARSRVGTDEGFALIAEVMVDNQVVSRVVQTVESSSLAEFGPSFAFLKIMAPVLESEGQVSLKLSRAKVDGTEPTELFTRSTPYSLN